MAAIIASSEALNQEEHYVERLTPKDRVAGFGRGNVLVLALLAQLSSGGVGQETRLGGTALVLLNMGDNARLPGPWLSTFLVEEALGLRGLGLRHWQALPRAALPAELHPVCCVPLRATLPALHRMSCCCPPAGTPAPRLNNTWPNCL